MKLGARSKIILALVAVLGVLAAWQGLRFWWYHGYSTGERTGILRKLSIKGTPMCKYAEGELALSGGQMGQNVEIFTFSVDDKSESHPLMKSLHEAARSGDRVTLKYRQDLKSWWRCTPHEYFVTGIELSEAQKAAQKAAAEKSAEKPADKPAEKPADKPADTTTK